MGSKISNQDNIKYFTEYHKPFLCCLILITIAVVHSIGFLFLNEILLNGAIEIFIYCICVFFFLIISCHFAFLGVKAHKIIIKHEYSLSDFILDCDASGLIILDTKKSKIFMIFVHRGNPIYLKRSDYLYVDRETVNHYFRKKTYIYKFHYLDNGVKTIWQFPCHSSWRENKFSQLLSKTKERIYPYRAKTSACTELQKRIEGREPSILEKPGKGKHITSETLRPLEKAIIESIKEMNEAYLDMPTVQDVAWCIIPYCEKIEEKRFAKRRSESISNKVFYQYGIKLRDELIRHNGSA